jgi:hypothetical protein
MGNDILDFIVNMVLVSIPEASFVIAFILVFMGKIEYLNFKRANLVRFFIPVLISAGTSSFLRVVLHFGMDFIPFLVIILVSISIDIIYGIRSYKKIMQCLACSIIALLVQGMIQFAYVPVSMSIMGLTMEDINKVSMGVICFTLPERVLEILLIAILLSKKKNLMHVNPLKIIINNRGMSIIFFSSIVLNLIFVYVFVYAVYVQRILANLSILSQLMSVMLIIMLPIINISAIIGVIYILAYREKSKRLYMVQETKAISALISLLSRNGNYTQIQDELKEFNRQIKEIEIKK